MNPPGGAATPTSMESVPPGDPDDDGQSAPWGNEEASISQKQRPAARARPSRMVGSIVDPAVSDDGLGLTGPGAPGSDFGSAAAVHPVRARLLEKARGTTSEEEVTSTAVNEAPVQWSASTPIDPSMDLEVAEFESTKSPSIAGSPLPPETQAPLHPERPNSRLPPLTPLPGTPLPGAVATELDRIARRPVKNSGGPGISPNMIALLGGLIGLTFISTLGVLLSRTESATPAEAPASKVEAPPAEEPAASSKTPTVERKKLEGPWRIADDASKPENRVLRGKIGKDAFLRAIQDAGLPKSEAYRAYAALKGLKDLDHCKSTDTFEALVTGSDKSLVAFEYTVSDEEVYQAKTNPEGSFVGSRLDLKVARNQIRRAFTFDGKSFEESARRAGFDPGLSKIAEVALRGHSSLSDFKRGDRLRFVAQEVTVLGEFSRYAGVEAMEILRNGEEPRRIYYYSHPVEGGHFDQNGKAPYEGGWRKPIPDAPVTSKFNMKRMHPVLNKVMPHTGTDFGAPSGTPIGATSPGVVSFRGPAGASGNLVKVKHDGGYESGYAHLSRFGDVNVGDRVERLQVVGYCGSTGRSTGPHLHFTMKKNDQFIDPESLNLDGLRVLARSHREAFSEVRAKYDPILDQIPLPEPLEEAAAETEAEAGAEEPAQAMMEDEEDLDSPMSEASAEEASAEADKGGVAAPSLGTAPTAAAVPAKPASAVTPSAIFLSDADLLKIQGRSDDGEVNE